MTGVLVASLLIGGCAKVGEFLGTNEWRLLDPSKVVEPHEGSPVRPIYAAVGDADVTEELSPNATLPTPDDLTYSDLDYIIGPTDILDISILDLLENGVETTLRREVSTSGYIDLPLVPERIKAEGKNTQELTDVIKGLYKPDILREPIVAVSIPAGGRRQSTYSIIGAVAGPGTYQIDRRDLRLLNALAAARGITQQNIKYIYVIRPKPARRKLTAVDTGVSKSKAVLPEAATRTPRTDTGSRPAAKTGGDTDIDAALQELKDAMGGPKSKPAGDAATAPASEPADSRPAPAAMPTFSEMSSVAQAAGTSAEAPPRDDKRSEKWVWTKEGKWIRVDMKAPVATQPSGQDAPAVRPLRTLPETRLTTRSARREKLTDPYGWKQADKSSLARVIAINLDRLRQGDPRLNIVIRDNDIIRVPSLEVGEFYVMGEVMRPGVYTLTGRKVTIKMALAAAGNLGPMADPKNCTLVRRIGPDQEQTVSFNLRDIFTGQEPDLFLKPNDVLEVGTNWKATFLAVVRNAFRVSYGFGVIYDRNFGSPLQEGVRPYDSRRFSRW